MDEAFNIIVGGVIFFITVTEDCFVQPNGLVIFKVYVPALFTTGINVFAPETIVPPPEAVHKKVEPGGLVEPDALRVTCVLVQLISDGVAMFTAMAGSIVTVAEL